jgi:capsid protein
MALSTQDIIDKADAAEARVRLANAQLATQKIALHKKAVKAQSIALSTYRAADRNRTNRDWKAHNQSADLAIIPDQSTVTARARQMVRDNDYAASVVRSFKRNVVGRGITPTFQTEDKTFNKVLKKKWKRWASDPNLVDRERRRNFAEIQKWSAGELVEVGESLVILSWEQRRNNIGLVLQCVESEQLDNRIQRWGENEVRGGVEVDDFGAAVAYHIFTRHPNDILGNTGQHSNWQRPDIRTPDTRDPRTPQEKGHRTAFGQSERIPAYENGRPRVLHIYDPDRVRQSRGISRMAPGLQRLRDLDQYDVAQQLAARAEASIGFVIKSDLGSQDDFGLLNSDTDNSDKDGNDELAMQPFMVARLDPGESIESFTPTRPGNLYDPYVTKQLRAFAAGSGLSYEQVVRDFSTTNWSGLRQGQLEDQREWMPQQELLICHLCQPVVEEFIFWCVMEGKAAANGYAENPDQFNQVGWKPDGWQWVDPTQQADGIQKMLDMGLTTKQNEANKLGEDWEEMDGQRKVEQAGQPVAVDEQGKPVEADKPEQAQPGLFDQPDLKLTPEEEAPADESAKNIVEGVKLNGAQITAALEILDGVAAGKSTEFVAIQLLISLGIEADTARQMVKSQINNVTDNPPLPMAETA